MKNIIRRILIGLVVIPLCGLSACDSGAKKLERKPKTHVRKKKQQEKELISVFESPAPDEMFVLLSKNLTRFKKISIDKSDTILGQPFVLGGLLSELTMALEIKDGKAVLNSLVRIQVSFDQLKMHDSLLDMVLKMPDKVVLKRKELFAVSESLFSKTNDFFIISGRDNDLAALKMGVFVHQMNVLVANHSKIQAEKLVQMLQLQRATAQNSLVQLIALEQNEEIEHLTSQLDRILTCFDRLRPQGQPEAVFKDDEDLYRINGGAEYISDDKFFTDLEAILLNFKTKQKTYDEV